MKLFGRKPAREFPVAKTDEEWKQELSPEAFRVLRKHGTERAHTGPFQEVKPTGRYLCAGCQTLLFAGEHKFESGSGWPSFFDVLPDGVETQRDSSWGMVRTEVHCSQCGGHLGHVFPDGPQPTGLRYCINGHALRFVDEPEDG